MTPLAAHLSGLIAREGPLSVATFMATALGHPRHGYYTTRDPLGSEGDFVTAPEVSQMFGELVGLWCADTWSRAGAPDPVALVELGPGRATLMADALRAVHRAAPAFAAALRLHLVETSPALAALQAARLTGTPCRWHDRLETVPEGPLLLIANEFFDALPIRQFIRTETGWCERVVGQRAEADRVSFEFGLTRSGPIDRYVLPPAMAAAPLGALVELRPAGEALMGAIAARIARHGGAALVIDYGSAHSTWGNTLRAIRGHRFEEPLANPGNADLTADVDFERLAAAAALAGARTHGPLTQGAFLTALGIDRRTEALKASATPALRADIEAARVRLVEKEAMGTLFKVLAVTAPDGPVPAAFAP